MITSGDVEQGYAREEAGACMALWAAVLREAVVMRRDFAYLETQSFRFICATMGLNVEWTRRKLLAAVAGKAPKVYQGVRKAALRRDEGGAILEEPAEHHRPRAKRTHSEATRAKLRAIWAQRRGTPEYDAMCAAISAGQAKRRAERAKAA